MTGDVERFEMQSKIEQMRTTLRLLHVTQKRIEIKTNIDLQYWTSTTIEKHWNFVGILFTEATLPTNISSHSHVSNTQERKLKIKEPSFTLERIDS